MKPVPQHILTQARPNVCRVEAVTSRRLHVWKGNLLSVSRLDNQKTFVNFSSRSLYPTPPVRRRYTIVAKGSGQEQLLRSSNTSAVKGLDSRSGQNETDVSSSWLEKLPESSAAEMKENKPDEGQAGRKVAKGSKGSLPAASRKNLPSSPTSSSSVSTLPSGNPIHPISSQHTVMLKRVLQLWAEQIPLLNKIDICNWRLANLKNTDSEALKKLWWKHYRAAQPVTLEFMEAMNSYNSLRSNLRMPPILKLRDALVAVQSEPTLRSLQNHLQEVQAKAVASLAEVGAEVKSKLTAPKAQSSGVASRQAEREIVIAAHEGQVAREPARLAADVAERHSKALREALEVSARLKVIEKALSYCRGRLKTLGTAKPKSQQMQARKIVLSTALKQVTEQRLMLLAHLNRLRVELKLDPLKSSFAGLVAAARKGDTGLVAFAKSYMDYLTKTDKESFEAIKIEGQEIVEFLRIKSPNEPTKECLQEAINFGARTSPPEDSRSAPKVPAKEKQDDTPGLVAGPAAKEVSGNIDFNSEITSAVTKHRSDQTCVAAVQVPMIVPQQKTPASRVTLASQLNLNEGHFRTPFTRLGKSLTAATKAIDGRCQW